ncbi:hypothetical protein N568_0110840 [Lactococcus garvieae TRF1]|uniref:Oleate hydratase n=1 Tax=Lactococcus garvieae TRF1 TaxID=1380772 RepID=V8AMV2_9LACT|nr:hypothetical protein N568_0110840 [Lactococcus garvieae TRF1]
MRYTNGNYEAFVRPRKPQEADKKSAYIVGAGLAGLAAAVFLIRDGQVPGNRIHILEELSLSGGSLDGSFIPHDGFVIRGGREMENHFECLWDLFHSIPSLEVENASVLDEFYYLDKDDPNSSNCRIIANRGERVADDGQFTLSRQAQDEIVKLFMAQEESLVGKKIEDVFSEEFFESNFWLYWCSMFAFEKWHSAIEMRRYIMRFIHHIKGLPDFTALKFTKYNQYESLVKPLLAFLKDQGVIFQYEAQVENIEVDFSNNKKVAKKIIFADGKVQDLTEDDLVFVTNGSITESSTQGSPTEAAPITWLCWFAYQFRTEDTSDECLGSGVVCRRTSWICTKSFCNYPTYGRCCCYYFGQRCRSGPKLICKPTKPRNRIGISCISSASSIMSFASFFWNSDVC